MNVTFTRRIREYEIERVLLSLPDPSKGARLLELGAGSGWQSKVLSEHGWDVSAIDLADSAYVERTVFPVQLYDGHTIPFNDNEFDVVFSSNVLEHVPHIDDMLLELRRVLKPGGLAIHVLPSASWRLFTSVVHYPAVLKVALKMLIARLIGQHQHRSDESTSYVPGTSNWFDLLRKVAHSGRHGESGNELSEVYYFSRYRWLPTFKRAGYVNITRRGMHLAYSGYSLFGRRISLESRRALANVAGSSCHLYIMNTPTKA